MKYKNFFWLHVKKSAGTTTRKLLQPYYQLVDKTEKPISFIQALPHSYNDILNNYRVVLGDYQFKRALFAKQFLYKDQWDLMCSFAFSREPTDRCLSMFFYLYYYQTNFLKKLLKARKNFRIHKKFTWSIRYDFDLFLELIGQIHLNSGYSYDRTGLHFSTHTAPMYNDITDNDGNVLLTKVFRMEDLHKGIAQVYQLCGLQFQKDNIIHRNKNKIRKEYVPCKTQRKKIIKLYEKDFDIYERALYRPL